MPTKIEWATETWNPITGCTPISEGCENCYAKRMANRLKGRYGYPLDDPFKPTFHRDRLKQPLKWKKPRIIFVSSMGDIFHNDVIRRGQNRKECLAEVWDVFFDCPQHTFLLLTKRPQNALAFYEWMSEFEYRKPDYPNIWIGGSVSTQKDADKIIPEILQIPAAVRFVSVEPMLGEMDIQEWIGSLIGERRTFKHDLLDWVICGAETGPGARIMKDRWAVDLYQQCKSAGVPFFFKKPSKYSNLELPREFPKCN